MLEQIGRENVRRFDGRAYRRIAVVGTKAEAQAMKARFKTEADTLVRVTEAMFVGKRGYEVWVHTPYIKRSIGRFVR